MIKEDIARNTPKKGVNVCGYDDEENVGERYYLIKNFASVGEAKSFAEQRKKEEPSEEIVMIDRHGVMVGV